MRDPKPLNSAWRAYRRWLFLAVGGCGTFFATTAAIDHAAPSVQRNLSDWMAVPYLGALAVGVIAMMRVWLFHCPNCGSRFHHEWGSFRVSFSKCQHCGLPLWGDPWGAQPPIDR